jgi:acetoin utilization deacetylase AcuC-like enzyme
MHICGVVIYSLSITMAFTTFCRSIRPTSLSVSRLSSSLSPLSSLETAEKVAFFYNDVYKVALPSTHKFPMDKYRSVRLALENLYLDSLSDKVSFIESPLATKDELLTTHCGDYIDKFMTGSMSPSELRATGFPWSEPGVARSLSSTGGTLHAMRKVMNKEVAVAAHLAGGTHHAFYDRGEGFCIFSDLAVAANCALSEYPHLDKILILDLDVHQGNGNAKLFEHDPRVFTFSMHCAENIFSALQVSDVDVPLRKGTTDHEYLALLKSWLVPFLLDIVKPQLVLYQAGVDILDGDRLGKLAITRDGIRKRNEMVYKSVRKRAIPMVVTMGGGYPRDLDKQSHAYNDIIGAHVDVYSQIVDEYL